MSDFSLDYGEIQSAYRSASEAASLSRSYSGDLKYKVSDKLNSLEGGGTGYTSNAGYFSNRKIQQLEDRAARYDRYAHKLDTFLNGAHGARNVDALVAARLKAESKSFRRSNNMSVNPVTDFFVWMTTTVINKSDFAKWLKDVFTDVGNWIVKAIDDLKYWYKCDGGKYIINSIVSIVLTAVAAAVIVFVAWPALLAASGVWATIVAAAGFVTALITLADRVVACIHDRKAIDANGEDPAWAKRYDGINSTSDFFTKVRSGNRFIDRLTYKIANMVNAVSSICAVINISDFAKTGFKLMKNPEWKSNFKSLIFSKDKWKQKFKDIRGMSKDFYDHTTMKTLKKTAGLSNFSKVIDKIDSPTTKFGGYITKYNSEGLGALTWDVIKENTYKKSKILSNIDKIWKKSTAIKIRQKPSLSYAGGGGGMGGRGSGSGGGGAFFGGR